MEGPPASSRPGSVKVTANLVKVRVVLHAYPTTDHKHVRVMSAIINSLLPLDTAHTYLKMPLVTRRIYAF